MLLRLTINGRRKSYSFTCNRLRAANCPPEYLKETFVFGAKKYIGDEGNRTLISAMRPRRAPVTPRPRKPYNKLFYKKSRQIQRLFGPNQASNLEVLTKRVYSHLERSREVY